MTMNEIYVVFGKKSCFYLNMKEILGIPSLIIFYIFRYAGQVSSKFCEDETTIWHATLGFIYRHQQETIQGSY